MTTARNVAGPPTTTNAVVDEEEVWEHCKRIQTAGLSEEVRRHSARNVLRVFAAVEPNRVQLLRSTLKFVSQVLVERYPNFLVSGQVNYAPAVLHKTLALLASLDVDDEAHDIAIAITARLVGIHAHSHAPSLRLFLHDAVTLLSDLTEVLRGYRARHSELDPAEPDRHGASLPGADVPLNVAAFVQFFDASPVSLAGAAEIDAEPSNAVPRGTRHGMRFLLCDISRIAQCIALQHGITGVLRLLAVDLRANVSGMVPSLWPALMAQLSVAPLALRRMTLQVTLALLDVSSDVAFVAPVALAPIAGLLALAHDTRLCALERPRDIDDMIGRIIGIMLKLRADMRSFAANLVDVPANLRASASDELKCALLRLFAQQLARTEVSVTSLAHLLLHFVRPRDFTAQLPQAAIEHFVECLRIAVLRQRNVSESGAVADSSVVAVAVALPQSQSVVATRKPVVESSQSKRRRLANDGSQQAMAVDVAATAVTAGGGAGGAALPPVDDDIDLLVRESPRGDVMATLVRLASERSRDASEIVAQSVAIDVLARVALALAHRFPQVAVLQRAARGALVLVQRFGGDLLGTREWHRASEFGVALSRYVSLGRWLLTECRSGGLDERCVRDVGDAFLRVAIDAFGVVSIKGASPMLQRAAYDVELRCQSLWCLALLPAAFELPRRVAAMTQALRESSNNVRALALSLLPLVLVAHGGADVGELSAVGALRQFAEPLTRLAREAPPEVQLALAGVASTLACAAMSANEGGGDATRRIDVSAHGYFQLECCALCRRDVRSTRSTAATAAAAATAATTRGGDAASWQWFVDLFAELRGSASKGGMPSLCAWLATLPRLVLHMPPHVDTVAMLFEYVGYLTDDRDNVRRAAINAFAWIVGSESFARQQSAAIARLRAAFDQVDTVEKQCSLIELFGTLSHAVRRQALFDVLSLLALESVDGSAPARLRAAAWNELQKLRQWLVSSGVSLVARLGASAHGEFQFRLLRRFLVEHEGKDTLEDVWPSLYPDATQLDVQQPFRELLLLFSQSSSATLPMTPLLGVVFPLIIAREDTELFAALKDYSGRDDTALLLNFVPGIFAAVYSSPLFPGAAAVSKAKRFIVEQFGCSLSNLAAVAECPTLNALLVRLGSRSRRVHLRACQALHVLRRIMQRFRKQQEAVAAAALHQRSGSTAPILNVDDDIENYTDDVPPDLARLGIEIDGPDDGDDGDDTNVAAAGVDDNVDEENAIDLSPVESELLASFLQLHFLSFMDFVAQRIAAPPATASAALSPAVDVGEQVEVLRSVQKLLPLLRDHINALSPKILTTLNLAMKQEPLRARACALWHTFIRCSSAAQLGHNLSRIFVDLLPHVEPIKGQVNEAVVSIMRALVIDRRRANALREHFRNIPVLADAVPADIRAAIAAASNSVDCATRLRQLADGVMHESADVRSCSLEALARLLREQQAYIQSKLVLPSPVPDASVLTVVRALLRRCRDASAQQRPQFAECLGLLGAIDPARIGDISLYESDTRDLDRAELAIELVNQFLVGELCAARNRVTQDRVSFAIQELMRVLDCSGVSIDALESVAAASTQLNKSEQSVLAMWNRLNESARAVVRPYLTSNYELLDGVEKPAVELPIYRPGRDRFWLLFWCQHLLSKVSGPTAAVFAACRGVLKDSTAVASFLLPHMVLNALQHGGDEIVHEISAELLAVLNTTASLYTPLRTPSQRGGFHAPPQQMLQQQLQQLAANASGFVAPHGGQMNVQRVFALYDWLSQWCAQTMAGRKRAAAHGPRTSQPRASEVNVVKLLELMPHRLLARGAAIARAWPRALRHIETHIREQWDEREQAEIEQQLDAGGGARGTPSRGGGAPLRASSRVVALQSKEELDEDIAFMYKIYSELDEPDGLAGVATLRPQVERELAADFVNAGRWQEALATYDAMLQLQSRSVTNRRGLLDTLSVTNLYYNLMTHAQAELPSLSCDDPSAPVLLSLGIEAAWRTSSWSLLERFLSHAALATDALQQPSSALMAPPPQAAPDDSTSTIGAGDKRRNDGTNAAAAAAAAANAVSTSVNFNVAIGRLLMALKSRQRERFDAVLRLTRIDEMRALSVASMESYERAYPHLVRLHMLTEVEQTWSVAPHAANELARVAPLESWSRRLQLTRPQFQTRQSLLWLRKALFELHSLDTQAQRSCLAIARAARHAGHHLVAQGALTHLSLGATASGDGAMAQRVAMERAMLLWSQGSHHAAVTTLRTLLVSMNDVSNRRLAAAALGSGGGPGDASHQQQQVVDLCLADDDDGRLGLGTARPLNDSEAGGGDVGDDRVQRAETLLLLGEWMEKTGEGEHRDIMQKYEDALSIAGDYERSHFRAASYWNTLVIATETRDLHLSLQSDSPVPEDRKAILSRLLSYVDSAIYHFGKSLQCGSAHVHESLSRLLTLWLDKYGYFMCHAAETRKGMHPSTDQKMLRAIESKVCDFLDKLPSYYFYECRAQIISRLRHQCDTIAKQLATIVTRMLQRYPDRTIWALISALNSSDKARQTIAEETVAAAVHKSGSRVENVVRQTRQLVAQLIALCDHTLADDVREMNLRTGQFSFGASLMRATRDGAQIVLPNLSALTVQLPADHAFREDGDAEVQPFDAAAPRCVEMLEHVVVFNSLQKPRRVVVRASDGVHYKFLGKKDDDLRKDARVIEFELLIGRLLSADAEARRRGLGVRTYSVVPLSETTGILEWVNNTVPVRGVLVDLYQERRQWHSKVSVRLYEQGRTVPTRVAAFEKLLKSHPPVLHRWFVNQFADASVWLRARLRYSRSLAVMSMVGFVLGLGDRHLENILIDDASGEVVFIDLNCIFLKAETFHYPEHVPFRLSQNLRDGMGVTKEEGVFRSVATITLRVLRNHRAMLMTVLETLIYDPLVDWKRHKQSAGDKAPQTEKRPASEEAEKDLHTVELKLLGQPHPSKVGMKKSSSALWPPIVKSTAGHGLAMTVEAQVDHLIREATDPRNLSHMFSGWASWL